MLQIGSLHQVPLEDLDTAREEAFRDYPASWSRAEYEKMLYRRGYVPELSFGAFSEGKLVSFTLNGVGTFDGLLTAYDTGTGTIPAFRGQGLAGQIFQAAVPALKAVGIMQYVLEVIQDNEAAVKVYNSQGFLVSREFNVFIGDRSCILESIVSLPKGYRIRETEIDENQAKRMWDYMPSWQNAFEALNRSPSDFTRLGVFEGDEMCGYGIIEPVKGDIAQIAVHPSHRKQGLGTALLYKLLERNEGSRIKVVNTDTRCTALTGFLERAGLPLFCKQYEMIRSL